MVSESHQYRISSIYSSNRIRMASHIEKCLQDANFIIWVLNSVIPRAFLCRQRVLFPRFVFHPFTDINVIKQCLGSTVGFFGGFDTLFFFLICLSQWTFLLWYHFFHKHFPFVSINKQRLSFPGGSVVKNMLAEVGDTGLIPGLRRSPGGGHGNPFQYSCKENSMDRGAWWATVHRLTKIQTQLRRISMHALLAWSSHSRTEPSCTCWTGSPTWPCMLWSKEALQVVSE